MEIDLDGAELLVFTDGDIWRRVGGVWKFIPNVNNHLGYNRIQCNYRKYRRHRIIAWVFLGLDLDDPHQLIDHIDGNRLNNNMDNLRIVNSSQNSQNRKGVRGITKKTNGKWIARLMVSGKRFNLGTYEIEEDAKLAYISAKVIYHILQGENDDNINKYLVYTNG